MIYGIDRSDPGLREFINKYIKDGGNIDLICYENYFSNHKFLQSLRTTTIKKLMKEHWSNAEEKYTEEETEFHQKIINILANQIKEEENKTDTAKKLTLQKK